MKFCHRDSFPIFWLHAKNYTEISRTEWISTRHEMIAWIGLAPYLDRRLTEDQKVCSIQESWRSASYSSTGGMARRSWWWWPAGRPRFSGYFSRLRKWPHCDDDPLLWVAPEAHRSIFRSNSRSDSGSSFSRQRPVERESRTAGTATVPTVSNHPVITDNVYGGDGGLLSRFVPIFQQDCRQKFHFHLSVQSFTETMSNDYWKKQKKTAVLLTTAWSILSLAVFQSVQRLFDFIFIMDLEWNSSARKWEFSNYIYVPDCISIQSWLAILNPIVHHSMCIIQPFGGNKDWKDKSEAFSVNSIAFTSVWPRWIPHSDALSANRSRRLPPPSTRHDGVVANPLA